MAPREKWIRFTTRKGTLADAVSEAYGEITALAEEMRSWADNMEERLSHTEKYERVSEAADALEAMSEPDIPDGLGDKECDILTDHGKRRNRPPSRADRASAAATNLDNAMAVLDELEDNDEAEQLRSDLENIKDELEGVEFPGMYG